MWSKRRTSFTAIDFVVGHGLVGLIPMAEVNEHLRFFAAIRSVRVMATNGALAGRIVRRKSATMRDSFWMVLMFPSDASVGCQVVGSRNSSRAFVSADSE